MQKQYELFLANDPSIQGKDFSDLELTRLVEIEKNLQVYNDLISELDKDIANPANADLLPRMQATRAEYSEKRTNLTIRKQDLLGTRKHLDDVQEQLFNAILTEYYELNRDKKDMEMQLAEMEEFFTTDAKEIFDSKMRDELQAKDKFPDWYGS